ncbi:MAG: hypothetical protein ACMZ66_05455 [Thalassospira sp.]|uniref:hypothetical protein n=1 Tax=Thalassospira sp. TaxID=1912094 RepID=UPI003A83A083
MSTDPEIITAVERINAAWRYPLSNIAKVEYEDRLNGLDPKILNKAIDGLVDECPDRPSVNQIKIAYDKHRPAQKTETVKPKHFYDRARDMANGERGRIIANCKPLFEQIKTRAGQAMLREYLQAAAWVMAQGVLSAKMSRPPRMAFDRAATGYMVWTAPNEDLHEARDLYRRGQSLGRIEIEVPARAMECFKRQTDEGFGARLEVKKMPKDEFEKAQQFHAQPA